MPLDIEKANEVINEGFDVLLEGLRERSMDKNTHLRMSDTTSAINSAIGAMRQIYSEKILQLRIISMLGSKQQQKYLPTLMPELKLLEQSKKKVE